MIGNCREFRLIASALLALMGCTGPAASADLGGTQEQVPVESATRASPWSFTFTLYGWLPWMSGDMAVKGRPFNVDISPDQIIQNLDWSGIPIWMSYAEARNGRISLFNDIVYANISGSKDFATARQGRFANLSLGGTVEADYEQATIELGGAYEVWSGETAGLGKGAVDVLGGGRYWYQDTSVSADLNATLNVTGPLGIVDLTQTRNRVIARSGSVDWVDPFIGARLRQKLAPGQDLTLRGDIGGFDVGSQFTWQVLATYNFQLCLTDQYVLDGYLGYRALSVDYSQGSGNSKYEFDVLMQGPVIGATLHF